MSNHDIEVRCKVRQFDGEMVDRPLSAVDQAYLINLFEVGVNLADDEPIDFKVELHFERR